MPLEIQNFLVAHGIDALTTRYSIYATRHGKFPNLVMFRYNQIESPMHERLVQECRGIILDQSDGWGIVSRPYDKFFNAGEPLAAAIDWSSATVYEKVDGSLCTLYHYAGCWHVASSGVPDAGGSVGASSMTFAELFWRAWTTQSYALPTGFEDHCFMFELCSPLSRIVVAHKEESLVLHGVRNVRTQMECPPSGWPQFLAPRNFSLRSIEECLVAATMLKPLDCEGYVVCDHNFHRVKVKSPQYVALAHAKDGFNQRAILNMLQKNDGAEFLSYFPELRADYEATRSRFMALAAEIDSAYNFLRNISSQKDFAAEALKIRFSSALFALRAGRFSSSEGFLCTTSVYALERLLGAANSPHSDPPSAKPPS